MNSITSIFAHDQRGDRDEDHGYSSTGDETRFLTREREPSLEPEQTVATSPRRTGRMLLATKLAVPPVRSDALPRPRLLHKLAQGTRRRLTLVAAAAGSGKTTLVSSWLRRQPTAVAWVSLDAADNDPIRWLMYVLTAVNNVAPHIGGAALAALDANQPLETAAVITSVLNDVAHQTDPVTLVLDDYHVITNDAVHTALRMLIEQAPPQLRIVLLSRTDPPLPLARLRARGDLLELRPADLRFTRDEATTFLTDVMGLPLAGEDVTVLTDRTEGWVAGLQLAALALHDSADPTATIHGFTGSHRYVLDYLVDEVLSRLPAAVQRFLLQTSILDRLTAPLCDVLTEGDDSAALLDQIERANLFLVPLDQSRCWYRYHHLFAQMLRERLNQSQPSELRALHGRAAAWFEQQGDLAAAINHALAARDYTVASGLIAEVADHLLRHGEAITLRGWLEALPSEMVQTHAQLSLSQAWTLVIARRWEEVESRLQMVERLIQPLVAASETVAPEHQVMLGDVAVMRAARVLKTGEPAQALALSDQALALLPETATLSRGVAMLYRGDAYAQLDQMQAARQAYQESLRLNRLANSRPLEQSVLARQIWLEPMLGNLRLLAALCREELERGPGPTRETSWVEIWAHIRLGTVHYEWDELDAAARHFERALELAREQEYALGEGAATLLLGRTRLALVDMAGGRELIEQARLVAAMREVPELATEVEAVQTRLWLDEGNLLGATRWLETARERWEAIAGNAPGAYTVPVDVRVDLGLSVARVLAATGETEAALEVLAGLREAAEQASRTGTLIGVLVVDALVRQAQGDRGGATRALIRALGYAAPERYRRTFLDEGPGLAVVLKQVRDTLHRGQLRTADAALSAYAGRLLVALESRNTGRSTERVQDDGETGEPVLEPLRAREIEVLRLLAAGRSNQEIADELLVSVGTIRWHLKNVYGKLGVHSRTHAVARARALQLIE